MAALSTIRALNEKYKILNQTKWQSSKSRDQFFSVYAIKLYAIFSSNNNGREYD